MTTLWQA